MPGGSLQKQLITYLTDAHSPEQNAMNTLRTGADSVDDPELAAVFRHHLEIASYRMLRQVAERADDQETVRIADQILIQEQPAADEISDLLERVADHDLTQMGLAA